jgi:hypothetical protein
MSTFKMGMKSLAEGSRSKDLFVNKLQQNKYLPVYKSENTVVGIRHANHVAPSILKI